MGQCAMAPDNLCVTLLPGEVGCINVSHPITNISDWFDLTITVHTTSTSTLSAFTGSALDASISNESIYNGEKRGGCGGRGGSHTIVLDSDDGRNFLITEIYTLGE
jgi:hypothetical protein